MRKGLRLVVDRGRIAMSAPDVSDEDMVVVVEVLRSGGVSLGPNQEEFEAFFAEYV